MKILIDNGHYKGTPGKCSPDRSFFEWKFNREIAIPLVARLKELGYDAERIVPEDDHDVTLTERCRRVNAWVKKLGKKNVIFISIHANAAPKNEDSIWSKARGISVHVSKNASEASKLLAQSLYAEVIERELQGNRSVPKCHYWQDNKDIMSCSVDRKSILYQSGRFKAFTE